MFLFIFIFIFLLALSLLSDWHDDQRIHTSPHKQWVKNRPQCKHWHTDRHLPQRDLLDLRLLVLLQSLYAYSGVWLLIVNDLHVAIYLKEALLFCACLEFSAFFWSINFFWPDNVQKRVYTFILFRQKWRAQLIKKLLHQRKRPSRVSLSGSGR